MKRINIFFLTLILALGLFSLNQGKAISKASFCESKNFVRLYDLVAKPNKYLKKKINIVGEFDSFSNLPLDYGESDQKTDKEKEKNFRSSKDYVGILLSRPDLKEIPLVELKLVLPLEEFKKNEELAQIENGNLVEIEGKVFSNALGEPWIDIESMRVITKEESEKCDS